MTSARLSARKPDAVARRVAGGVLDVMSAVDRDALASDEAASFRCQMPNHRGNGIRRTYPSRRDLSGVGIGLDAGVALDWDPSGLDETDRPGDNRPPW